MTTQFHEGQDVEVHTALREISPGAPYGGIRNWCKATIVGRHWSTEEIAYGAPENVYEVQFSDGSRAVFDAERIREATS